MFKYYVELELPYQENTAGFFVQMALTCIPFFEIPFVYTMICSVQHFKTQFSFRCLRFFPLRKLSVYLIRKYLLIILVHLFYLTSEKILTL